MATALLPQKLDDDVLEAILVQIELSPILYDKCSKEYKNDVKKAQIFAEIGAKFDITGDQVKAKFSHMRDSFRKNIEKLRKAKRSGAGAAEVYVKPYKWAKQLQFLLPHLQPRKSYSNLQDAYEILEPMSIGSGSVDNDLFPENDDDDMYDSSFITPVKDSETVDSSENLPDPPSKRKKKADDGDEKRLIEYLERKEQRKSCSCNCNKLKSFFLSQYETVKDFPLLKQIEIKNKIWSLVSAMELSLAKGE